MTAPTLVAGRARRDGSRRPKSISVATQTKPPARYTEATLLSAMEGAGKLVEDEELREAMSEKGLGTPATRAAIIEGLIYETIHPAQRPRIAAHGQGLFPHHPSARAGHSANCPPRN